MARPAWLEREVHLATLTLHLRQLPGEGTPLLLLHGLGVDGSVWQGASRRLAADFSIFAPDLRGHGLSDHPPGAYTAIDYAEDVAALVEQTVAQSGPLALLGHSLGAIAALGAALRQPAGVSHLILEDPPSAATPLAPYLQAVLAAKPRGREALLATVRHYQPELGDLIGGVQAAMWERTADGVLETMLEQPAHVFGVDEWYDQVATPTLLMAADPALGARLRPERATALLRRLRRGSLTVVRGAGHVIHAQQPAEFCRLLREFVLGTRTGS